MAVVQYTFTHKQYTEHNETIHRTYIIKLKAKSHKSPVIDQITAELIKVGVEKFAWRFINSYLEEGETV